MSNPLIHCSSCTFGVGRSRSVKFALVRTRRKGGGACELSSAELPLIRPFASLAGTSRAATVRVFLTNACVYLRAWWPCTFLDRVRTINRCILPARSTSESSRSIGIAKSSANFLEHSSVRSFVGISFISLRSVELSAEAFLRFGLVGLF